MLPENLIKEINAVRLGPGDVLVVKHPQIGVSQKVALSQAFGHAFPGKKILIVPDFITLEVVTPDALGEMVKDEV
jgi:hypothetical protein